MYDHNEYEAPADTEARGAGDLRTVLLLGPFLAPLCLLRMVVQVEVGTVHPERCRGGREFAVSSHSDVVEPPEPFALEEIGFPCNRRKELSRLRFGIAKSNAELLVIVIGGVGGLNFG